MKNRFNGIVTKLIAALLLALVILGILKGTDIIVSVINTIFITFIPCIITIGGLYILIKSLFK